MEYTYAYVRCVVILSYDPDQDDVAVAIVVFAIFFVASPLLYALAVG